jgi:hypothetical protein
MTGREDGTLGWLRRRRRGLFNAGGALVVATLASAGCSHTKTVSATSAASPPAASTAGTRRPPTSAAGTPLPRSPQQALQPGQLGQIQRQLASRGLLGQHEQGQLDEPTRKALKQVQREHGLPETGVPDHETVSKLGLDPERVFEKGPSAR